MIDFLFSKSPILSEKIYLLTMCIVLEDNSIFTIHVKILRQGNIAYFKE